MKWFILSLCLVFLSSCQAQSPSCDCFNVSTTSTMSKELTRVGRLYSQAASYSSRSAAIDSVCLSFNETRNPNETSVKMIMSFTDGKPVVRQTAIQTMVEPGQFFAIGPTRSYKDFIMSKACSGVYVIYRCIQSTTCVKDIRNVDVFVTSTKTHASERCINKGKKAAQKTFPLRFYPLPRNAPQPCNL